ncbi:hypothetical protein [Streptomyces yatensis]|uniref:Uncharacterized protein n=1 Tax=Streptomyces yatensis TaxID=155177 RepID=A0ABP4SNY9_9ACTN|nr:hypothetical protein [Streptomyces yatensis]
MATTRADHAGPVPGYLRTAFPLNAGPTAARVVLRDITEHLGR